MNQTKGTEERPASKPILERGVGIHVGTLYGGGRIAVFPGRVLVTIGKIARRVGGGEGLIHTTPEVVMIKPRIGVPWLNTGFVFHDGARVIVASTPVTARRSVTSALRSAGFHVRERRTWISLEPTASERSSSDDARLHSQARLARVISAASVALFFVSLPLLQRSSALTIARFLTFLSAQSVTADFVIARTIPLTRSTTRRRAVLVVNVICLALLSSAATLLTVSWLM